ncbi:MAG: NrdH-redoxin [Candidatus Pacebacteria bacterium]|nr:NrdH-redoxin [Candidatus Paceibacterota bacterium]
MHKVSIYTTVSCHFCHMAKEYFKENNIAYDEFDVGADPVKRKEMLDMTKQMGVPVIRIDDSLIVGFNKPKVAELLGLPA